MSRIVAGICAVLATGWMGVGHPALAAETITAKSGLEKAVGEAKIWKPDAELFMVGTSLYWSYRFQSKKTRTCANVNVLAVGKVTMQDVGECTLAKPVAATFVDSPAAVAGAKSGGFQAGEDINFVLSHRRDTNLNPSRECWGLSSPDRDFDKKNSVMRGWCVDPKSGKFVTRLAGEGGK